MCLKSFGYIPFFLSFFAGITRCSVVLCKENYAIFLYGKRELLETKDVKKNEKCLIFV